MSQYNFKKITVVPSSKDFKEIVLSKTQRKTPTVVHKSYAISRIRQFYIRKIKYAQQTIHDKMTDIINQFPKLDDVHPFYADLMNILYDKDHYKIALGQISTARHLVDNVAREYVRLMKYGDSLYRCKMLKRAALGRYMKVVRKQKSSFEYLEQVRQHLARLPSIDPNTRTLILCGFPNVGKSSFMNCVTRADVEVQPYAFTTKSLYVGHMDYKYLRWQVIDTPGILDHALEERNTIEMQAVTALAHLRAAIVYVLDVSELCDRTLEEQMALFNSIRPLFANKPVFVAVNKIDVRKLDEVDPERARQLFATLHEEKIPIVPMSTVTKEGVLDLRNQACDELLAQRVEAKLRAKSAAGNADAVMARIHLSVPTPRDNKARPATTVPEAILRKREARAAAARKEAAMEADDDDDDAARMKPTSAAGGGAGADGKRLEKHIEAEQGDDYVLDLQKSFLLENDDEKYDKIPEIWNGYNIADFVDTDIKAKLEALRAEEREREANGFYDEDMVDDDADMVGIRQTARKIRRKQLIAKAANLRKKKMTAPVLPTAARKRTRSRARLETEMSELGVDIDAKRMRNLNESANQRHTAKSIKVGREPSLMARRPAPRDTQGVNKKVMPSIKKVVVSTRKPMAQRARKGEGDRHIPDLKPKHLFSGKRKMGKTARR